MKQAREKMGYSQSKVAKLLNIDVSTYSRIENGHRTPRLPLALKIKEILNYKDDDIFDNE